MSHCLSSMDLDLDFDVQLDIDECDRLMMEEFGCSEIEDLDGFLRTDGYGENVGGPIFDDGDSCSDDEFLDAMISLNEVLSQDKLHYKQISQPKHPHHSYANGQLQQHAPPDFEEQYRRALVALGESMKRSEMTRSQIILAGQMNSERRSEMLPSAQSISALQALLSGNATTLTKGLEQSRRQLWEFYARLAGTTRAY